MSNVPVCYLRYIECDYLTLCTAYLHEGCANNHVTCAKSAACPVKIVES